MKKKPLLFAIILLIALLLLSGCKEGKDSQYKKALDLMAEGKYSDAVLILDSMESYEDSSRLSMYCKAIEAGESGDYESAVYSFKALGSFKDSEMLIS